MIIADSGPLEVDSCGLTPVGADDLHDCDDDDKQSGDDFCTSIIERDEIQIKIDKPDEGQCRNEINNLSPKALVSYTKAYQTVQARRGTGSYQIYA